MVGVEGNVREFDEWGFYVGWYDVFVLFVYTLNLSQAASSWLFHRSIDLLLRHAHRLCM